MGDVEEGRRFIQQQDAGLLRECHGNPHALTLPTRELIDRAVGKVCDVGGLERLRDDLIVLGAPAGEHALVRMPPPAHEVGNRNALGRDGVLRQQADLARDLLRRGAVDFAAIEHDPPGLRREQTGERAQKRRLSASVGPDDRRDRAGANLQVEVTDDRAVAVREREALGGEPVADRARHRCRIERRGGRRGSIRRQERGSKRRVHRDPPDRCVRTKR